MTLLGYCRVVSPPTIVLKGNQNASYWSHIWVENGNEKWNNNCVPRVQLEVLLMEIDKIHSKDP